MGGQSNGVTDGGGGRVALGLGAGDWRPSRTVLHDLLLQARV